MHSLAAEEEPRLTRHGTERLRQRGYRKADVGLVLALGTPMGNAVVLTDRDVTQRIAECRRLISQLERLRGSAVVLAGDRVLSVYRPRRSKLRRLLRHRQGRGLGVPRYREVLDVSDFDEEARCA
jgi:hypothetical protein